LTCGPEARELAGDLGEKLSAGEEMGKGKEGADSPGPAVRERKGRKRRAAGRKMAPTRGARMAEKERGRGAREKLGWLLASRPTREGGEEGKEGGGPRAALGRGKKEREREPAGKERKGGMLGCCSLLFSSFFLFYPQTIQTIYLNSNKFEFKPYKFNTRKTMLQHECTNILIL
jgi:hypothetical protein